MSRWQRGAAVIERQLAGGELQNVTGAAANGDMWLTKARRSIASAAQLAETDPDGSFVLAYDAARCACVALLTQQGLRATTRGGHYAVEVAVRAQFGGRFDQFGAMRRLRNDIEYPFVVTEPMKPDDAHSAVELATELADAAARLLPNLGLFE
jgi:hypothetical protein